MPACSSTRTIASPTGTCSARSLSAAILPLSSIAGAPQHALVRMIVRAPGQPGNAPPGSARLRRHQHDVHAGAGEGGAAGLVAIDDLDPAGAALDHLEADRGGEVARLAGRAVDRDRAGPNHRLLGVVDHV